jgi:hypothetical protein
MAATAGWAMAGDGWSLAKLNPFRKESRLEEVQQMHDRVHTRVSDEETERGGFPKFSLPGWGSRSPATSRSSKPSTLTKLNQGTKDFFGKTKDVLMPWSDDTKRSGSRDSGTKTSFLPSWLKPKPAEPKRPESVKEFLGRPRPY